MRKINFLAAFVLFGVSAFAADPGLMNLVMPDAKVLAGMNVTTAKISPLGQYMLAHIASNGDKELDSFVAESGFDPRQDVSELIAASVGGSAQGLVLARGNFNVAKISAAVAKDPQGTVQQYNGATLIIPRDGKLSHAVAFIGSSIAVVGDAASVKAAVDRNQKVNSIDPALAARVQQLSTTLDAWSVTLSSLSALLPQIGGTNLKGQGGQMLNMVKDIQQSSGGLKLGANVEVTAQAVTSDPKNATALSDVIKMVAGLAGMAAGKDPHAQAAAQMLQKLVVNTAGTQVNLSLMVPEADVEALLKPALQAQKF